MALGVRPTTAGSLAQTLRSMGLTTGMPTVLLVGAGTTRPQLDRLGPLLEKVVLPVVKTVGAVVVDEGDLGGVGGLLGETCRRRSALFPLIGVAPERDADDGTGLDPNHTHFVVVPADRPGWAAAWTSAVGDAMAGVNGSVALVIGGGEPAWDSVVTQTRAGRRIITVAHTGGVADQLAVAMAGGAADSRAAHAAASGRLIIADPTRGAAHVADLIRTALTTAAAAAPKAIGPVL